MTNKNNQERVSVYIDGNNFFGYLKDKEIALPRGIKFDLKKFVNFIVENRKLISKRYYVGIARNIDGSDKSRRIVKGQQKFLSKIQNDGFIVKRGKVMYDGGKIRGKGYGCKNRC